MVFVLLAPVIYQLLKKTKLFGLTSLYLVYFLNIWVDLPGLSAEGLFFFSAGAYFAIHGIDFTSLLRKRQIIIAATLISCPLVITMVLTYGNYNNLWGYACRAFTLSGVASTIGIVALLFKKQRLKVHPLLSSSSFFVYAAHGTIVFPRIKVILDKVLPYNQFWLIVSYFAMPVLTIALLVLCYYFLSNWMPKTLSVLTGGRVYRDIRIDRQL